MCRSRGAGRGRFICSAWWSMKASMRMVPMSNMLLLTLGAPEASEGRRTLLRRLMLGIGAMVEKWSSGEMVPLWEEGMVPWLEKLRRAWRAGRGAVLLRLRLWEKRGTWGASAASSRLSFGSSGTEGGPSLANLLPGRGRGRPLATRMESRIGFRRSVLFDWAGSSVGIGGRAARSCRPIAEWLRKERAVSQT